MRHTGVITNWTNELFPHGLIRCNDCDPGNIFFGFQLNNIDPRDVDLRNRILNGTAVGLAVAFTPVGHTATDITQ